MTYFGSESESHNRVHVPSSSLAATGPNDTEVLHFDTSSAHVQQSLAFGVQHFDDSVSVVTAVTVATNDSNNNLVAVIGVPVQHQEEQEEQRQQRRRDDDAPLEDHELTGEPLPGPWTVKMVTNVWSGYLVCCIFFCVWPIAITCFMLRTLPQFKESPSERVLLAFGIALMVIGFFGQAYLVLFDFNVIWISRSAHDPCDPSADQQLTISFLHFGGLVGCGFARTTTTTRDLRSIRFVLHRWTSNPNPNKPPSPHLALSLDNIRLYYDEGGCLTRNECYRDTEFRDLCRHLGRRPVPGTRPWGFNSERIKYKCSVFCCVCEA